MELKYFKEFNTKSDYDTYINGDPILPNVSFVGQDVYYKDGVPTPHPIISAGMICYADSNNKLKFVSKEEWDSSLGTAQGVVVVPSNPNHTIDGTARIVCITGINTDGTESSYEEYMGWCEKYGDTELSNMDKVPTWDNTIGGTIGNYVYGYLPSDDSSFTGATCATDSIVKYNGDTPYIPSPYLEDGSQNPAYINTVEATTGNCLSDFNGKGNTEALVGLGSDYVAANACNKYGTSALPAGNWYLPACGELGYIIPRFNEIQQSLEKVGGVPLNTSDAYWSSTVAYTESESEYSIRFVRSVWAYDGNVSYSNEGDTGSVFLRAFASIPVE